jgi:hypothetical protein
MLSEQERAKHKKRKLQGTPFIDIQSNGSRGPSTNTGTKMAGPALTEPPSAPHSLQNEVLEASETNSHVSDTNLDSAMIVHRQRSVELDLDINAYSHITHTPTTDQVSLEMTHSPPQAQTQFHFYLHRPHTPSSKPIVLIPVPSDRSLSELLRNRVILEFPSIYILACTHESLPSKYMTEARYLSMTEDDWAISQLSRPTEESLDIQDPKVRQRG